MKKSTPTGPQKPPRRAIKNGEAAQLPNTTAPDTKAVDRSSLAGRFGKGRSSLSDAQRAQVVELLSATPPASDAEIARRAGCSVFAVRHLYSLIGDVAERTLRAYQRRFGRELPAKERVSLYGQLARGQIEAKRAFSALKALQRIEELEGIVTKREQKEAESKAPQQPTGPVFVIQGASVQVSGTPQVVVASEEAAELPEPTDAELTTSTS